MTNEELVIQIQDGNSELILDLWENVKKLITKKAIDQYNRMNGTDGNEIEDFIQQAYFAFIYAIEHFDRNSGFKFTTYLTDPLRNAFREASGYRTSKRDPINNCLSLDLPLDDTDDSDTLLSSIEDPSNQIENIEENIWLQQLKTILIKALEILPEDQRKIIEDRYFKSKTIEEIAQELNIPGNKVRASERNAYDSLFKNRKKTGIEQFVDDNTNYYFQWGVTKQNNTNTSTIEKIILYREKIRDEYKNNLGEIENE